MILTLPTLIVVFLFDRTLGKAIDSQRNNEDVVQRDSRGMHRAKEMLWINQANFSTNPQKSETNNRFAFEQFSVPISNKGPVHFKQLSVPMIEPQAFSATTATMTATMTQVPATATTNAPKYQIDKYNATQNLLLFSFKMIQQLRYQVFCCLGISNVQ
jgi:hypothetical protein